MPSTLTQEPAHSQINIAQFGEELPDDISQSAVYDTEDQYTLFTTSTEPSIIILPQAKTSPQHCDRHE